MNATIFLIICIFALVLAIGLERLRIRRIERRLDRIDLRLGIEQLPESKRPGHD